MTSVFELLASDQNISSVFRQILPVSYKSEAEDAFKANPQAEAADAWALYRLGDPEDPEQYPVEMPATFGAKFAALAAEAAERKDAADREWSELTRGMRAAKIRSEER